MNAFNLSRLHEFLKSNEFRPIQSANSSEQFGNFFEDWQSSNFNIRIINDRSILSFAISAKLDSQNWFEVELINGLVYGTSDFSAAFEPNAAVQFLMGHFDQIGKLFAKRNYSATKETLEEMRNLRMKQLFPNL
jgi:hypothetical protein